MPDEQPIDSTTAMERLRACHTRRLDREGIPMVLALQDESAEMPEIADLQARADGERFAELLGEYAELLIPSTAFRSSDEGALITVMQVLAYAHFGLSKKQRIEYPGDRPVPGGRE